MSGPEGNGGPPGTEPGAEHPIFGHQRHLIVWHRVMLVLVAFTAGRWVAIAAGGVVFGAVPQAEMLLAALELTVLAVLVLGLFGFTRLAPWSMPLLLVGLFACAMPLSRRVDVVATAVLGGQSLPATLGLARLDAPSLGLTLRLVVEILPLALAVWLLALRPAHRRVALEGGEARASGRDRPGADSPSAAGPPRLGAPPSGTRNGATTLRPRRMALVAAAAAFALPAVSTATYLARLEPGTHVAPGDAVARVEGLAQSQGMPDFACAQPSPVLDGPLVRPFYLVLFVLERPPRDDRPAVPIAGVGRSDAGSGDAMLLDAIAYGPERTTDDLCGGLRLDTSVRVTTRFG